MNKRKGQSDRTLQAVLTVPEVAEMHGIAETTVTRALKRYQATGEGLKGVQRSRFWMIAKEDAEQWTPPRPRTRKKTEPEDET